MSQSGGTVIKLISVLEVGVVQGFLGCGMRRTGEVDARHDGCPLADLFHQPEAEVLLDAPFIGFGDGDRNLHFVVAANAIDNNGIRASHCILHAISDPDLDQLEKCRTEVGAESELYEHFVNLRIKWLLDGIQRGDLSLRAKRQTMMA